jgi:hypothetical protein
MFKFYLKLTNHRRIYHRFHPSINLLADDNREISLYAISIGLPVWGFSPKDCHQIGLWLDVPDDMAEGDQTIETLGH